MTKELSNGSFDYSQVPAETKGKLICFASELRKQAASHAESGLEMGRILLECQSMLGDGQTFREWINRECVFGKSSAYNFITAWKAFGACPNFGHIEMSAMYVLAKNDGARKKALRLANKGEIVTHAMAKDFVAQSEKATADKLAPKVKQAVARNDIKPTPKEVERLAELDPVEQEDIVETVMMGDAETVSEAMDEETITPDPSAVRIQQIQANRKLAKDLIDRAVRAVDDLHRAKPNELSRAKVIRLLQDAGGLVW